jgi:hypothetical protein
MFVLCVVSKDKGQNVGQSRKSNRVRLKYKQSTSEYKKIPDGVFEILHLVVFCG